MVEAFPFERRATRGEIVEFETSSYAIDLSTATDDRKVAEEGDSRLGENDGGVKLGREFVPAPERL